MSNPRPELVHVSGPQAGQRQVIMQSPAVMGRDPLCDLAVEEPAVSRHQVRFDLTADGWMITNLSSQGTRVNGKNYKSNKKHILLETGDLLMMGAETVVLFVGPEDDPDHALRLYREQIAAAVPPAPQPAPRKPEPEEPAEQFDAALAPQDEADVARKAKVRKYAIFGGIYLVALIGLVIFLSTLRSEEEETESGGIPPLLTQREIENSLDRILGPNPYRVAKSDATAERMLSEARRRYDQRLDNPGNLYRALKAYQLYIAYKSTPGWGPGDDQARYNDAWETLTKRVESLYQQAYTATQAQYYREALGLWNQLQDVLPVTEEPMSEPDHPIFNNIKKHVVYIGRQRNRP